MLDLDDIGTEVTEHHAAGRAGDDMAQFEDAHALERQLLPRRLTCCSHAYFATARNGDGVAGSAAAPLMDSGRCQLVIGLTHGDAAPA